MNEFHTVSPSLCVTAFWTVRCIYSPADGNKIPTVLHRQYCAIIRLDTNGLKNPNQFGADAYGLYVKPDAIVPETWNAIGYESLKSILTGSGKLTYKNYSVGQKYDF